MNLMKKLNNLISKITEDDTKQILLYLIKNFYKIDNKNAKSLSQYLLINIFEPMFIILLHLLMRHNPFINDIIMFLNRYLS